MASSLRPARPGGAAGPGPVSLIASTGVSSPVPAPMNLRHLAKTGIYYARHAGVRALAVPRGVSWVRQRLHLPANRSLDPLAATPADGIELTRLDHAERFHRAPPEMPCDPAALAFFATRAEEENDPSYVVALRDGAVWGCAAGAVFTADGRFLPALSRDPWGPDLHAVWTRLRLPRPERLPGRVLYLVTPEAEDNFHHWMLDLLPRLGLVQRAGYTPAEFDHVIVNHRSRRYQLDTLARIGVPLHRVRSIGPDCHIRADLLVVPSLKRINQSLPAADVDFLRRLYLGALPPQPTGRRIFLSRGQASFRRLLNEAELLPLLELHGFEIVTPSSLPLPVQARLFAESEWIAGPAGAAFVNLVFAPPSARVLEIAPPDWLSVYHWMISARRGLRHTILLGEGEHRAGLPDIGGRRRDFTFSPSKLAAWLHGAVPSAGAGAATH